MIFYREQSLGAPEAFDIVDTSNLKDACHMVLVNSEYVFPILHVRLGG